MYLKDSVLKGFVILVTDGKQESRVTRLTRLTEISLFGEKNVSLEGK
jgi:hypothetical protein